MHAGPAELRDVHFITGLPCSGKTTVSRELARAIGGTAIIVGDLIRAARAESAAVAEATAAAFAGHEEYSPEWLADLVATAIGTARFPVVLDGAAPMDRVLPVLGITVASVLVVEVPDAVRHQRFESRRAGGSRADDTVAHFEARSRFHAASLSRIRGLAPRERVFGLAGHRPIGDVVRQALSAVVLAEHMSRRPQMSLLRGPDHDGFGDWVVDAVRTARQETVVLRSPAREALVRERNNPVLLFKPGHAVDAPLVDRVLAAFGAAGYTPAHVAVWPGATIAASRIAPAHLELHFLLARWAAGALAGASTDRPAYDLVADGWSIDALDAWWHGVPTPQRVARCHWVKRGPTGEDVVNGHIPAMVVAWQDPATTAVAIQLAAGAGAVTWERLRLEVLGHSDPVRAHPASVRGMAHAGVLRTGEPVSLKANLVHLSAGPLDAVRERWLWLGGSGDERGEDLIDHPRADGGWCYEHTEHRDAAVVFADGADSGA